MRAADSNRRPPRVTPVTTTGVTSPVERALAEFGAWGSSAFFRTMANNPVVLPAWGQLVQCLLDATLPARERELLILRTAYLCQATYPWSVHEPIGRAAGLSEQEIERLRVDPAADGWSVADAALLAAVGEIHCDSRVSDPTWERLQEHFTLAQLVEIPVVVGFYHLNAYAANTLDIGVGAPGTDHLEAAR
jgi:4-carboxymuconolactone decarboxylase